MAATAMEAMRQSCIRFVEAVDKACRLADAKSGEDRGTLFDSAVERTMSELAAVPAIHRLRGRVREAGPSEVIAAMTALSVLAADKKGVSLVDSLIGSARSSDKPEVAAQLQQLQEKLAQEQRKEAQKN